MVLIVLRHKYELFAVFVQLIKLGPEKKIRYDTKLWEKVFSKNQGHIKIIVIKVISRKNYKEKLL